MENFFLIFKHYFKLTALHLANLSLLGFPLINLFVLRVLSDDDGYLWGTSFSSVAILFLLAFQHYGADMIGGELLHDFKGVASGRLLVTGNAKGVFFAGAFLGTWVYNLLMSLIMIAISAFFFDVAWPHYGLTILVFMLLSFITQIMGILLFYTSKDEKTLGRVSFFIGEVGVIATLATFMFPQLARWTGWIPARLAYSALSSDGWLKTLLYLGILAGVGIVLVLVAIVVGKKKPLEH